MKLFKLREIIEESLDRVLSDLQKPNLSEIHHYYLIGLKDSYAYTLDMCKILEAKEGQLVQDECDG
jgi:hypothetical protein